MVNMRLQCKITESKALFYLSPVKRALFFFITGILLVGILFSVPGTPRLWIPEVVAVLSLLGGLYSEKWSFNKKTGSVFYFRGLPVLGKTTRFSLDSIEEIRFTLIENQSRKPRAVLFILLENGELYDIDAAYGKTLVKELQKKTELIAEFCQKRVTFK